MAPSTGESSATIATLIAFAVARCWFATSGATLAPATLMK